MSTKPNKSLAQAAYEAFAKHMDDELPWVELPQVEKEAWQSAVTGVIDRIRELIS